VRWGIGLEGSNSRTGGALAGFSFPRGNCGFVTFAIFLTFRLMGLDIGGGRGCGEAVNCGLGGGLPLSRLVGRVGIALREGERDTLELVGPEVCVEAALSVCLGIGGGRGRRSSCRGPTSPSLTKRPCVCVGTGANDGGGGFLLIVVLDGDCFLGDFGFCDCACSSIGLLEFTFSSMPTAPRL